MTTAAQTTGSRDHGRTGHLSKLRAPRSSVGALRRICYAGRMSERVLTQHDRGVLTITFNRPDKKNAFTRDMYTGIVEAIEKGEADPATKVTILTGSGGSF